MDHEEVVEDVPGNPEVPEESEGSLSDDLSAAWEASEGASGDSGTSEGTEPLAGSAEPLAGSAPAAGVEVAEHKASDGGDVASADGPDGEEHRGEKSADEPSPGAKPPLDWSPELREKWAGLPEGVKAQIAGREAQMAQAMQGTSQARRVAQEFTGVANRYGSVMAAEGVSNPVQMFDAVMQTVSELRMGSGQQKANKMAELIQTYGIDIKSLDDALAGQISGDPQAQGGNPDLEAMLDQRMQPVNDMMQRLANMQQQKQQASQLEAQQEVNDFSANAEFLQDVRHDVADLIDMATRQGREMSLEEAYKKACAMNPQISSVLSQREEQARLTGGQIGLAGKRNAGSSLRPGNVGGRVTKAPDTLHGSISAAWDEQLAQQ